MQLSVCYIVNWHKVGSTGVRGSDHPIRISGNGDIYHWHGTSETKF